MAARPQSGQWDHPHPEPERRASEWLTLDAASRRLGVHVATLRRWTNLGLIASHRTAGGHRRFRADDFDRYEQEHTSPASPASATAGAPEWTSRAIEHTQEGLPLERWLAAYDQPEREHRREMGRQFITAICRFVACPDEAGAEARALLDEARAIGREHGRRGRLIGRPLAEHLDATRYFRASLLESALFAEPSRPIAPASGAVILRRVERLVGEFQAGILEGWSS